MTRVSSYGQEHIDAAFQVANMRPPSSEWRDSAACGEAAEYAFQDDCVGEERREMEKYFIAAYCRSCEVKRECLYTGVTLECSDGVWGGRTSREVRRSSLAYKDIISGALAEHLKRKRSRQNDTA